jgi:peptide/nickel transport system permease protein
LRRGAVVSNAKVRWGLTIVAIIALSTILAPILTPFGPEEITDEVLASPGFDQLFGTDRRAMDVFTRTLYAPRVDLTIGVLATLIAFVIGVPLGTVAGMFEDRGRLGGFASQIIMRGMDVMQSFPVFVFALALVAVLGTGAINLVLGLAFVNTPVFVRQIRTGVLVLRDEAFVEAALVAGWSRLRIAFRHVLPNALGPASSLVSVMIGFSILLTAGLSFVGAGVRVPTAEWGVMIAEGSAQLSTGQWWPSLFPGLSLALTVFGFSMLGEGLRETSGTTSGTRFSRSRRWAERSFS